jgi:RNA polymerase sigma factor (sigma-70 family)
MHEAPTDIVDDEFAGLMQRVRGGSEEAAKELVNRYGPSIRRAVRRAMSERLRPMFDSLDFVQLVWKSLFQARDKLDAFRSPCDLTGYLVTMARNKVIDEARCRLMTRKHNFGRETSLQTPSASARAGVQDPQPTPIEMAIARDQWDRILKALPTRHRRIVELRLQGCTHHSIAESLGLNVETVGRALRKLLREIDR